MVDTILILLTLIVTFCAPIFDRILAAYDPDGKKMTYAIKSVIKKGFIFIRYALPVGSLILLSIWTMVVDKKFVFSVAIYIGLITVNITYDWIYKVLKNQMRIVETLEAHNAITKSMTGTTKKIMDVISENKGFTKTDFSDKEQQPPTAV